MGDLYHALSETDARCNMFSISFSSTGERDIFIETEDYDHYWSEMAWSMDCSANYLVDFIASGNISSLVIDLAGSGHTNDNTEELRSFLKHVNNVYTRWYNKKYGQTGALIKITSIVAIHTQRQLFDILREMYQLLRDMGRDPNTWLFCGRHERRIDYSLMRPEPYSSPGYMPGLFSGISERRLYQAIVTKDEMQLLRFRDKLSTQDRNSEYQKRMESLVCETPQSVLSMYPL